MRPSLVASTAPFTLNGMSRPLSSSPFWMRRPSESVPTVRFSTLERPWPRTCSFEQGRSATPCPGRWWPESTTTSYGARVVEIRDAAAARSHEASVEVLDVQRDVVGDVQVHVPASRPRPDGVPASAREGAGRRGECSEAARPPWCSGGTLPDAAGAPVAPGSADDSTAALDRAQASVAARTKATWRERIDPPALSRCWSGPEGRSRRRREETERGPRPFTGGGGGPPRRLPPLDAVAARGGGWGRCGALPGRPRPRPRCSPPPSRAWPSP